MVATLLACGTTCGLAATGVDPRLTTFAAQKRQQTEALAAKLHLDVPAEAREFFKAAEAGDWGAVSNCSERIWHRTGQGESSIVTRAFTNVLWEPIRETLGAYEQFQVWDPAMLQKFADGILRSLPDGSIYIGGTRAGEYIITAVRDVAKSPDVFVITPHGMADSLYMDYLRLSYGSRIWVPSEKDIQQGFQQYIESARRSQQSVGEVKGVLGVMNIMGILTKAIFDHNKDKHEFYVEESVVIPWMYPYLEPHGLILRLNKESLAQLDPAIRANDRQFWDTLTKELLADQHFVDNKPARQTFAKLRTAMAGLYAYRKLTNEAEAAFKQAVELGPTSPEANFRLTQMYIDNGRFNDAVTVLEQMQSRLSVTDPVREHATQATAQIREMKRQADDKKHESNSPNKPQ
jgi:hypothetical protein